MVKRQDIHVFADRIARAFQPDKVILFGSHARGEATEHSDVDLMVVMPDDGDPLGKSIEIVRRVGHPGFALDLIVRDPHVLRWRLGQHDWFLMDIMEQGQVLYETADAGVGAKS